MAGGVQHNLLLEMLDPCAFAMTDVGPGFYDRILILRLQT